MCRASEPNHRSQAEPQKGDEGVSVPRHDRPPVSIDLPKPPRYSHEACPILLPTTSIIHINLLVPAQRKL